MKTTTGSKASNSSMVQRLLAAGNAAPKRTAKPVAPKRSAEEAVLSAVRAADPSEHWAYPMLSVAKVRAASGLPKAQFDAAAVALQASGAVSMTYHDAWQWLSAEEQAKLVDGGNGYKYNTIMVRGAE